MRLSHVRITGRRLTVIAALAMVLISLGFCVWGTAKPRVTPGAKVEAPNRAKRMMDAREVVRVAEQFIRENGYTGFVPEDPRRLVPESMENSRDPLTWLKERHNQLKPQAVGYLKGCRNDPEGWTVGFALVKPIDADQRFGRAVTMDGTGHRLRIEHMGFNLDVLEPRSN